MGMRILTGLVLLLVLGAVVFGVYLAESRGWFRDREAEGRARDMLTRPLRLEASSDRMVVEFLEGVGTFHYRVAELGEATYRDRFYDTPGGALGDAGIVYRLRERLSGRGGSRWSVRFEQRDPSGGRDSIDLRSDLSDDLGRAIAAGDWMRPVTGTDGLVARDRLRARLAELGIDPADVTPRFVGELVRTRHELTDRGRSWFELDVERWTFRIGYGEPISFTDVVIDTRLKKSDPEIERRVNTMDMLIRTMFAFEETDRHPAERARERLLR